MISAGKGYKVFVSLFVSGFTAVDGVFIFFIEAFRTMIRCFTLRLRLSINLCRGKIMIMILGNYTSRCLVKISTSLTFPGANEFMMALIFCMNTDELDPNPLSKVDKVFLKTISRLDFLSPLTLTFLIELVLCLGSVELIVAMVQCLLFIFLLALYLDEVCEAVR